MSICVDYYYPMLERHLLSCSNYSYISASCCSVMIKEKEEEHRLESPMPWIGIYAAAASLVCSLAMVADIFHGFRHRKLWFPCKFFTLNAASLTLLAVSMKLPVDLSTTMPGELDQLAKLTSTTLMSTVIGNFMPSIGAMDDTEIFMNITALTILVITVFVNICIQLNTQLINPSFEIEHIAAISFMLVLLVLLSFSALTVSTTKKCLQLKYDDIHKTISSEEPQETEKFTIEKLKVNVEKYWMIAKSSSPQFVVARSVTCYASGTICFLAAFTLAEAHLRIFIRDDHYYINPSNVRSNYRWSAFVVLVIQSFGVVGGTIAPTFRWFTAISLRCKEERVKSYKTELKTENYWIERLLEWKESPLALRVGSQKFRKLVHNTKNLILDFCIAVQVVIVLASKLVVIVLASILFVLIYLILISPFMLFWNLYNEFIEKIISKHTASTNHTRSESGPGTELDLSPYVLYLEGEEELPLQIMKNNRDATNHFIQEGKKRQPKYLKELLDQSTTFTGVTKFDSHQVPSLASEEPSNCWSLPVVTLTSIAIALPNIEKHKAKWLLRSVSEGLLYANLVEKFLNAKSDMVSIRNAVDTVWLGVDLFHRWLDEDLQKISLEGNNSTETLEKLADIAKNSVIEFKANTNGDRKENPQNWPIKVIAANSMYRISRTVLENHRGSNDQTDETLFEQLCIMIADILGACLTNLPRVIIMKCFCSAIEEREKSVQHAAQLLGETEEILKILQQRELPNLNPDKVAYIDEWHALIKQENPLAFTTLINDGTSSSGSGELHIAIE
ncbi:uncharacterized protein LOC132305409 [Cornus florida]|uniref:uncharacterized protein LOC132305409 n=1 Tax=Cornus florida TaxID=4283 RepID=UPI00289F3D60|nr:uncharacterized protein LOC132305409 [Cornus florida]